MTLYRAVSLEELSDIRHTGILRPGRSSCEGKHFAYSREDAAQWGELLYGGDACAVVGVQVREDVAARFVRWDRLDGIGPACFATMEDLTLMTIVEVPDEP